MTTQTCLKRNFPRGGSGKLCALRHRKRHNTFHGNVLYGHNRLFATPVIVAQSGIFARPRADREGGNGHKNEAAGGAPPLVNAIPALPPTDRRARPPRTPRPTPPCFWKTRTSPTGGARWWLL